MPAMLQLTPLPGCASQTQVRISRIKASQSPRLLRLSGSLACGSHALLCQQSSSMCLFA